MSDRDLETYWACSAWYKELGRKDVTIGEAFQAGHEHGHEEADQWRIKRLKELEEWEYRCQKAIGDLYDDFGANDR